MRSRFSSALLALIVSVAAAASAQEGNQPPPALQQRETVASPAPANPQDAPLTAWQQQNMNVFANDFGQRARYRDANAALPPRAAGEHRVVFFGDSITDNWKLDISFPGKGYINRGIGGQTTSQMLVRFRQDVLDLKPELVVILAGTNDIAGNNGPISLKDIEANLSTLAELARVHGIRVILSSVTPVNNYTALAKPLFDTRPIPEILQLNEWMRSYCTTDPNASYLNYYDALVDERGMMRQALADDGLHPNAAGYKIMAPIAQAAIEKVLVQK